MRLYVNGNKVLDDQMWFEGTTDWHCTLGDNSNHDDDFDGYISGFRIWENVKLTDGDVNYIKNKTFDGYNSFSSGHEWLNQHLVVNMYTAQDEVYSTTSNIRIDEFNINRTTNKYHPPEPPRPWNFSATENCWDITLNWDASSYFSGAFDIYRKDDGFDNWQLQCRTKEHYFIDNNTEPNKSYVYSVQALWHNPEDPLSYNNGNYDS